MTRRLAYLVLVLAAFPSVSSAQKPSGEAIRKGMQRFVDEGHVSGLVALVGGADGVVAVEAIGKRDLASDQPMEPDTIFRVMSLTKPITAVAVMMLVDEGKVRLDDPVEQHLPEFRGQKLYAGFEGDKARLVPSPRAITIRDLLTHTSGLPDTPPPGYTDLDKHPDFTLAEAVKVIAGRPLSFPPGTKWAYSNAGMSTLGRLVEVVSGKPFDAFLRERLFGPLGMVDTTFYPTPEQMKRVAIVYDRKEGKLVEMPSSRSAPDPARNRPSPAGGLFSTAEDLGKLCRMMLNRGTLDDRRYLSEKSVAEMTRLQTGDLKCGFVDGMGFGLGWGFVKVPQGVTASLPSGTFGHGGAYGTQGWVDPKGKRFVVLMIQRVGLKNADDTPMRQELQRVALGPVRP
ncbi:MAG TPA: serine hydrolase domain-containing protein [Isosphaeraceae bacterium]